MTMLRQVTKRHIIARDSGQDLGEVGDVFINVQKHRVSLVVLSYGKLPELSVVCDSTDVESFGMDVLVVPALTNVHLAIHDQKSLSELQWGAGLRGRPVATRGGKRIGRIAGIEVNDRGAITHYQVAHPWYRFGFFRSKQTFTPAEIDTIGGDAAVAHVIDEARAAR